MDIEINYGIKTGFNEAFIIDSQTKDYLIKEDPKNQEIIKPILRGKDINKWQINFKDIYLLCTKNGIDIQREYPSIFKYLTNFTDIKNSDGKSRIIERSDKGNHWSNLRNCAYYDVFEKEKIIWAEMVQNPSFYLDNENFYILNTAYALTYDNPNLDLYYLLSILNSKLSHWYFGGLSTNLGKKGVRYIKQYVSQIPICIPELIDQKPLIDLTKQLIHETKQEKINKDNIEKLENEINNQIYKLYKLNSDEIKLIETTQS